MSIGKEIADAYIQVHADTDRFRRELQTKAARALRKFGREADRTLSDQLNLEEKADFDGFLKGLGKAAHSGDWAALKKQYRSVEEFERDGIGRLRKIYESRQTVRKAIIDEAGEISGYRDELVLTEDQYKRLNSQMERQARLWRNLNTLSDTQGKALEENRLWDERRRNLRDWVRLTEDSIDRGRVSSLRAERSILEFRTGAEREVRRKARIEALRDWDTQFKNLNTETDERLRNIREWTRRTNDSIDQNTARSMASIRKVDDYLTETERTRRARDRQAALRDWDMEFRNLEEQSRRRIKAREEWDALGRMQERAMREMHKAIGTDFDRVYIGRLKGARNDLIHAVGVIGGTIERTVSRRIGPALERGITAVDRFSGGFISARPRLASFVRALPSAIAGIGALVGAMTGLMLILQPIAALLSGLGGMIVGVAAVAWNALGGLLAALGPIILAVVGGIGALVIGISGMTDEMKASAAPIGAWFEQIQGVVAQNLFGRLHQQVEGIMSVLENFAGPLLERSATALSNVIDHLIEALNAPDVTRSLDTLAVELPRILENIGGVMVNLATGLTGIFSAVAPSVARVTEQMADGLASWSEWTNSAEGRNTVAAWFDRVWESVQIVWDLIGALGGALGALFGIGDDYGDNWVQGWIDGLNRFTESLGEGQDGRARMVEWFERAKDVASDLGGVIDSVVEAFQSMSVEGFANDLDSILGAIGFIFDLLSAFSSIVNAIKEPLVVIITAFAAFKVGSAISKGLALIGSAFTWLGGALATAGPWLAKIAPWVTRIGAGFAAVSNPIGWVITAISLLVAGFIYLWNNVEGFRNFFIAVWDGIKAAASAVADWFTNTLPEVWSNVVQTFKDIWNGVGDAFSGAWDAVTGWWNDTLVPWFSGLGASVSEWFSDLFAPLREAWESVSQWFSDTFGGFWEEIQATAARWAEEIWGPLGDLASDIWDQKIVPWWQSVVAWFDDKVEWVKGIWDSFWGAIGDALSGAWDAVTGYWNGTVVPWFTSIYDNASDLIGDFFHPFYTSIVAIWELVSAHWNETIWPFISGLPGRASEWLGDFFHPLYQGVVDTWESLTNWWGENITPFFTETLPTFFTETLPGIGQNIIDGLLQGISDAWSGFTDFVSGLVDSFVQNVRDWLGIASPSTVFSEIGGFLIDGLIQGITEVWETLTGIVTGLLDGLTSIISGAWDTITGAASTAWEGISGVVSGAWDTISSTTSTVTNNVKNWVSDRFSSARDTASNIWGSMKRTASSSWESISSSVSTATSNVRGWVSDRFSSARDTASNIWGSVKNTTSSAWGSVSDTVRSRVSDVGSRVSTGFSNVRSNISTAWSNVTSNTTRAMGDMYSSVRSRLSDVTSRVRDLPGDASRALSNVGSALSSAGRNLISGFMNGMGSMGSALRNKASELASGAVNSIKGFLGIASPSRLMHEQGQWFGLGLVQGIDATEKKVLDASTHMAEVALQGISHSAFYAKGRQAGTGLADGLNSSRKMVSKALGTVGPMGVSVTGQRPDPMAQAEGVLRQVATGATGRSLTFSEGAVQVITPTKDPELVAQKAVDKIIESALA